MAAHVPFRGAQHDPHSPERGMRILRHVVHGIIVVHIVVIIPIRPHPYIKQSAHGKKVRYLLRMPEREIGGMISSKAASGHGYAFVARFPHSAGDYFVQYNGIIAVMVVGAFRRARLLVVPAEDVDPVRTINLYPLVIDEPGDGIYQAAVFTFIVAAHGSRKEDEREAAIPEDQHFKIPVKVRRVPFIIVFCQRIGFLMRIFLLLKY